MRGELHGGYQDDTNPSLRPTTQVRERKKTLLPRKSDHLSKPEGLQTPQQQPNTVKKGYFMKEKHSIFLLREKNSLWVSVSEQ